MSINSLYYFLCLMLFYKFFCAMHLVSNSFVNNTWLPFFPLVDTFMMEEEDTMLMDTMENNNSNDFCSLTSPGSNDSPLLHPNTPLTPATPKTPNPTVGTTDLDKVVSQVHVKEEDDHSDDEIKQEEGLDDDKVS